MTHPGLAEPTLRQEDKEQWLLHPVTRRLLQALSERVDEFRSAWADGQFTHQTTEGTALKNAQAIGQTQGIEGVITWIKDKEAL